MPCRRWITLLGFVPLLAGCVAFREMPPELERPLWRPSDEIPPERKNCVYTFVFGTLDIFDKGHPSSMRDHAIHLGFVKTYFGQSPHLSYFAAKIREIAAHCPTARFAVVGFDNGAAPAAELAVEARKAGVFVDLLVFVEPFLLPDGCNENLAGHVVTIHGNGGLHGITAPTCGEVVRIDDANHSAVPNHRVTIEVLERELTLIAMGVALPPRSDPPKLPLVEPMPAPRKTPRRVLPLPAEWRFLEPYRGFETGSKPVDPPTMNNPQLLPHPRVVENLPTDVQPN